MKKILVVALSFVFLSLIVQAQENAPSKEKKYSRPNIPGAFVWELGLNRVTNPPNQFNIRFWGSRTMNVYYQYDMRILKSKFSFHPGIGLGMDRYSFKNYVILAYDNNGSLALQGPSDYDISGVRKTQLITNYLDVPLELRFSTNPEDPARSFKISVGVRGGMLFNSHTKVKYKEDGNKIKDKVHRDFNLNKFRYGVYAKIGGGNFSIFGYYNLSPLFKKGQGPVYLNSETTEMNNFTIGISLSSF